MHELRVSVSNYCWSLNVIRNSEQVSYIVRMVGHRFVVSDRTLQLL